MEPRSTTLRFFTIAASVLAGAVCLSAAGASKNAPLRTVDVVDLKQYSGKWFEIARLPNKFQKQCAGDVTAHYTLRKDGKIDVVNRCTTADKSTDEARGLGRKLRSGKSNARLEVRFAPAILSFLPQVWDDYWIIGLGPDYTWAVVAAPNREYLWILGRAPAMTPSSYEQAVAIAKANGFDVSQLVKTLHAVR